MTYRFAFVLEQTLGHVTHAQNLAAHVKTDPTIDPIWLPIHYGVDDVYQRLPVVRNNCTLTLSLRARAAVRASVGAAAEQPLDAMFFHTQVIAHAAIGLMRRTPAVVSLDATPINRMTVEGKTADDMRGIAHAVRRRWTAAVFARAADVVAWSEWAAASVVRDYGTPQEKVHVIPPGVDLTAWQPTRAALRDPARPRVLFIGKDFVRKGGRLLLDALKGDVGARCEIDFVTDHPAAIESPGVRVHRGVKPNSQRLHDLATACDIFALPTHKDFTPLAIIEAMACGLPVVATDVGAIREQVEHGVTGLLVPPNDPAALAQAICSLLSDPLRRANMGRAGRARAERLFDAARNTQTLTTLMKDLADARRATARTKGTSSISTSTTIPSRRNAALRTSEQAGSPEMRDVPFSSSGDITRADVATSPRMVTASVAGKDPAAL